MQEINKIGEFGLIDEIRKRFADIPTNAIGIGDDCAILPANEREDWLVSTDLLIEDVHFLKDDITPEQLGYKSLAVNLSDIAAMGGTPLGAFLSIALPNHTEEQFLQGFFEGFHTIAQQYNTPLLGGDTTLSKGKICINVCVIGRCNKGMARCRNMAKAGDAICVTGVLGDSAGGLKIILEDHPREAVAQLLVNRHYNPIPQIEKGTFLAQQGIHAMMDISDGIASDLPHILKASNLGAEVELTQIPASEALMDVAHQLHWNIPQMQTCGGEDYELLFTAPQEKIPELLHKYQEKFGQPFYIIGETTNGESEIKWKNNNQPIDFQVNGFRHF